MSIGKILMVALGLGVSCSALATWQMVSSSTVENHGPFFQAGLNNNIPSQSSMDNNTHNDTVKNTTTNMDMDIANNTAYELHIYPGTLESNLQRIMKNSPYKLLWKSPYDYRVASEAVIHGKNFDDALNRFLMNYPVKAIFYEENNIMTIVSRKP